MNASYIGQTFFSAWVAESGLAPWKNWSVEQADTELESLRIDQRNGIFDEITEYPVPDFQTMTAQELYDTMYKILNSAPKPYMVDVAKVYMNNGEVIEYREAHSTEYLALDEAQAAYDKAVQHWQAQPDKPVCITLSERDGEMWDGIKSEVVQ